MNKTKKDAIYAHQSTEGRIYITQKGVTVLVKKIQSTGVYLITEFSDKLLVVKRNSLLCSFPKKKLRKKTRDHFAFHAKHTTVKTSKTPASRKSKAIHPIKGKAPSAAPSRRGPKGPQSGSVRAIVDPLLLEGNYTICEMAEKLAQAPISHLLRNKDTKWYISDRIWSLKKAGYQIQKSLEGKIKATTLQSDNPLIPEEPLISEPPVLQESSPSTLLSRLARLGIRKKV